MRVIVPREFTRLDEIADILFSAAIDIKQEEVAKEEQEVSIDKKSKELELAPVSFHDACISRIQDTIHKKLIKRSRTQYSSPDKSIIVNCAVSREYNPDTAPSYWFAFHPHQKEVLKGAPKSYVAFGCGTNKRVLLIPFSDFDSWLDGLRMTEKDDRSLLLACDN